MSEQTDNLPVVSDVPEARVIERPPEQMTLSAPVAAATGGVLAGIATFAIVRILRNGLRRRPTVRLGKRRRQTKLEIAGSRSFLVDVHILNKR